MNNKNNSRVKFWVTIGVIFVLLSLFELYSHEAALKRAQKWDNELRLREYRAKRRSSGNSSASYSSGSSQSYSSGKSSTPSKSYASGTSAKSNSSRNYSGYDAGYEDLVENGEVDYGRYDRDQDYADGVDDAADEFDLDW